MIYQAKGGKTLRLHLPMANFWIEADGKEIPYQIADVTDSVNKYLNSPYHVDQSCIMLPEFPRKFQFDHLQLLSDVEIKHDNYDDWISDEFYSGASWILGKYIIGAAAFVDNAYLDDHADVTTTSYPEYFNVDESFRNKLIFQISYKTLAEYRLANKSSKYGDLSLDFSFDEMQNFLD